MPRRLTIPSREKIKLELYLIYSYAGQWESEWASLQGVFPLPEVTKEVMDMALTGWTRPLLDELGPPPEGRLRKMPSRECEHKDSCTFYREKDCQLLAKDMPWCFEPKGWGVEKGAPGLATRLVHFWREGVYVVVVTEERGEHE